MLAGFALLAVMLFVPAGTWQFYQAWVMLGVLFVPMAIMGAVMLVKNPELLSKRLNANEKEQEQKWVVALSGILLWQILWWQGLILDTVGVCYLGG